MIMQKYIKIMRTKPNGLLYIDNTQTARAQMMRLFFLFAVEAHTNRLHGRGMAHTHTRHTKGKCTNLI